MKPCKNCSGACGDECQRVAAVIKAWTRDVDPGEDALPQDLTDALDALVESRAEHH